MTGRRVARVVMVVFGVIAVLFALSLLAGGAALVWAQNDQTNSEGFFTTDPHRFESSSYAITSEKLDLDTGVPGWLFGSGRYAKISIDASSAGGKPIFVGIGRSEDVDRYLSGTDHDEVTDFEADPFSVEYENHPGSAPVTPPGAQRFWVASANGGETLVWGLRKGKWSAVAMNADGTQPVAIDASFGAKVSFLGWIAAGVLIFGALLLIGGSLLIYLGLRKSAPLEAGEPAAVPAPRRNGGIPGRRRGPAGRAAQPLALAGQVAARDPALHRARFLWIAFCRPDGRRVLRDPLHRALPARDLRLQRRRPALDLAGRASTPTARSAPTGTRRSRSTRCPTTPPRWRSRTRSGCRADSCS